MLRTQSNLSPNILARRCAALCSAPNMTATAARGLSPPGSHSDGPAIASRGLPGRGLKRAAADAPSSVCNRLFDRQIDARAARTFEKQSMRQRFLRLRPRLTCDVYPAAGPSQDPEFAFIRRSSILEIVVGGGLIFGLAESGLCSAFDMDTGRRVCVLNRSSREVIRSLFHNKLNGTLIIVAVTDADQYSSLRCRSWCAGRAGPLARHAKQPQLAARICSVRFLPAPSPHRANFLTGAALSKI